MFSSRKVFNCTFMTCDERLLVELRVVPWLYRVIDKHALMRRVKRPLWQEELDGKSRDGDDDDGDNDGKDVRGSSRKVPRQSDATEPSADNANNVDDNNNNDSNDNDDDGDDGEEVEFDLHDSDPTLGVVFAAWKLLRVLVHTAGAT